MMDRFHIEILSTAANSPQSNGVCKRMVEMMKEGIKKVKGEDITRQMAMTWTVSVKNCLSMKNGFSPKQLPNLMGEKV